MSPVDSAHLYPSTRERQMDYRLPQPVEIDMNNSNLNNSRTLPSPSASAAAPWDPFFPIHEIGEMSAHGPSSAPRHVDGHNRGTTTQESLQMWYTANDGPWVPQNISEIPKPRVSGHRTPVRHEGLYRQPFPLNAGQYQFGAPTSDSGYGSNAPKRSDGSSIFSADIPDQEDCQSLPSRVATDFPPYQGSIEALQQRELHASESWTLGSTSRLDQQPQLVCPDCNKVVKTKSELKYGTHTVLYEMRLTKTGNTTYDIRNLSNAKFWDVPE